MFNSFNPNPIRRRKRVIYKNILLSDIFVIALGLASSLICIYYSFSSMSVTNILIGLIPLVVSGLLVIPFEGQTKLWHVLVLSLAFPLKKRVYLKNQKKLLIPYKSINENNGIVKLKNNKFIRISIIRGFNFTTLTDNERDTILIQYRNFLRQMEVSFSMFGADIDINYESNFELLKNSKTKHNKEILKVAHIDLEHLANVSKKQQREIFFIFYGSSEEELLNIDTRASANAANAYLDVSPLVIKEKIMQVLSKAYSNNEAKEINDLINTNVRFSNGTIKMNNKFISIISLSKLKFDSELGWLYPFMTYPNAKFIMNVEKYNLAKAIKKIDTASSEARGTLGETNLQSEYSKNEKEFQLLNALSDQIQGESELLFSTSGYFIVEANNKHDLSEKIKKLKNLLNSHGCRYSNLTFRQKEGFEGTLFLQSKLLYKVTSIEIPSSSLANAFPFHQDYLNDPQGTYLGYSQNGENIFLDIFNLTEVRKNNNLTVLGQSGGGKTTAVTKLAKDLWLRGSKVIIVDPQDEHRKLTKSLGGQHIDLGVTSRGKNKINPLEWYKTENVGATYSDHMLFLEAFFKVIFPEINDIDWSEIDSLLQILYRKFKVSLKTKSKEFPTLKDLSELADKEFKKIKKNKDQNYRIETFYKITSYLNRFKNPNSPESILWNGHTNFDITNGKLYTFDIHTLSKSQNDRLINAQYHILIKYVFSWMIENRLNNKMSKDNAERLVLVVDEGHKLINERMPAGIDFLYEMSKTMRKFNGSIVFATQNISDLLGGSEYTKQKTSAIINNSQYTMLFSMNPDDLGNLQKMNESSSYRFSQEENNYIVSAKKGECLLMLSPMDRKMIKVDVSEEERLIWKDQGEI